MAILPTSTTGTSFIPHTGTLLTLQGEPTLLELLNGAINSLQNDAPAQTNEFVKQLQQVSPATANRIFHLTWKLSGEPNHFENRFGEEAFFGYWGRSIDPSIKLEILGQVFQETAAINAQVPYAPENQIAFVSQEEFNGTHPFDITEIVFAILSHCDLQTIGRLACVNSFLNACVTDYDEQLDLKYLCPNLRILDAEAQEFSVNDEPRIRKLRIWKNYIEIEPHVENREGLTLLTMPQGRTLNQLITIAAQVGITVDCWNPIVQEHGNVPVGQTYVILITNSIFQQSRGKSYPWQQKFVGRHRCVLPTVQEYVALCIFTNKIFQKCLYGQNPWIYGSTSTQCSSYPSRVGGFAPTRLFVDCYCRLGNETHGASGQRKFSHMARIKKPEVFQ